jgi:hypothetical protein
MFTGTGEGLELACTKYLNSPEYSAINVVGVSFPYGVMPPAALQIPNDRLKLIQEFKIPIIRASSPFEDLVIPQRTGASFVRRTLETFSGGMALCVQAILVACDAGLVRPGEHLVSMCADTSILAKAAPTSMFFSIFAIREVICKPVIHDISKGEILAAEINVDAFIKRPKRIKSTANLPLPMPDKVEEK